ncbi:MAG TPA: glycosyltransferase family 2 protein [Spirochaetota bacterium]|jgi:dolichol-phosphate mannosyltransferase|nr:glycosyltransferase family 2 protein [Spirochaetota bacterium]HOK93671.1 glycosyltransferase family 2 protein [Spirochaetota bacterium]HPP96264.1 glycosyltransferase family 2 protein [Spirochaetota bacterium]
MEKVSIIVPTFKEAENIPELTRQIDVALKKTKYKYEIIIVDDNSQDGIDQKVKELEKNYPVKLKIRLNEKGLSSAVIAGFELASGEIFLVMDADLSHPPEKIPEMLDKISKENFDFVIGSRFVKGGSAEHFNIFRTLNALVSRMIARPFTSVKDPMAGFFAFKSSLLEQKVKLNPLGFKIGLELLVKLNPRRVTEIPIQFQERLYGKSKLTLKQQILYLIHIWRLFRFKFRTLSEFIVFSLIGASGMVVDLSFVFISYDILNLNFRVARVIGFVFALTSNFMLNRKFNFPKNGHGIIKQYIRFFIVSLTGFAVNWTISVYLYETRPFFNKYYLLAAFLGILGGLSVNFLGSKFYVFKQVKEK